MAQPIICSATTTGPETEKIAPCSCLSSEPIVEVFEVDVEEMGEVEVVELVRAGESGSGGSSGGGGVDARCSLSSRLPIKSRRDG